MNSLTIDRYSVSLLSATILLLIDRAEKDGVIIDDGNVVDLIADNTIAPLADIRAALLYAGLGDRFPMATSTARHSVSVVVNCA